MAKQLLTVVGAIAVASAVAISPAVASTLYVDTVSAPDGIAYVVLNDPAGRTNGGTPTTLFEPAGQFEVTAYHGTSATGPASVFNAWCVDINDYVNVGGLGAPGSQASTYTPSSSGIAAAVNGAFGNANLSIPLSLGTPELTHMEWLAQYGFSHLSAETTYVPTDPRNALSAAIQVAIWDIEYGTSLLGVAQIDSTGSQIGTDPQYANNTANTFTSDTGSLYSASTAAGIYNAIAADMSMLDTAYSAFVASGASFPVIGLVDATTNGTGQAMLAFVPEPASMALLAGGMIGLGALRRRRR